VIHLPPWFPPWYFLQWWSLIRRQKELKPSLKKYQRFWRCPPFSFWQKWSHAMKKDGFTINFFSMPTFASSSVKYQMWWKKKWVQFEKPIVWCPPLPLLQWWPNLTRTRVGPLNSHLVPFSSIYSAADLYVSANLKNSDRLKNETETLQKEEQSQ